jgi:hypothetical protein
MQTFYGVDTRRLGFGELWRISPGVGFLVGAAMKVLGIRLKMDTAVPWLDGVERLEEDGLPPDVRQSFATPTSEWQALGFTPALCYTIPMRGSGHRSFARVHLSPDGTVVAQTFFAEKRTGAVLRRQLVWNCVSSFADGSLRGASSSRKMLEAPPEYHMTNMPGAHPDVLYRRHQHDLAVSPAGPPLRLAASGLEDFIVRVSNRAVDFNVRRGVYVPLEMIGAAGPPGPAR